MPSSYDVAPTQDARVVLERVPHDDVLAFAGLYELWPHPAEDEDDPDRWLWTSTVLTTRTSDTRGRIHDRSPAIVPPPTCTTTGRTPPSPTSISSNRSSTPCPSRDRPPTRCPPRSNPPPNNSPDLLTPAT
ncbi:SOS response-associated peptidase family protein [Kineococcus rhizosphaerae]|uniref:SOS response-associated peptidase family protein n=1 Tax=Kineococcus rhizosphaerae TaxID=559628 RepID=UPI001B7FF7C1